MALAYADRGFISINGVQVIDVQGIHMDVDDGTKYVETMTNDRTQSGVVKGNRKVSVHIDIAVQGVLGTPKIEDIDYQNNDVALTYAQGGDRYSVHGLDHVKMSQSAPGVGQEGKKGWDFIGLKKVDQVGNSDLFSSGLSSIAQ